MEPSYSPAWMREPDVQKVPKNKLDYLQKLVFESASLSQKELLPFLMALAQRGKTEQISFSPEEAQAIVAAIKKHSTPEEVRKMDRILKLMQRQSR